ncbi:hypothetical protein pb186bvf_012557 [Paramecium bursaria]
MQDYQEQTVQQCPDIGYDLCQTMNFIIQIFQAAIFCPLLQKIYVIIILLCKQFRDNSLCLKTCLIFSFTCYLAISITLCIGTAKIRLIDEPKIKIEQDLISIYTIFTATSCLKCILVLIIGFELSNHLQEQSLQQSKRSQINSGQQLEINEYRLDTVQRNSSYGAIDQPKKQRIRPQFIFPQNFERIKNIFEGFQKQDKYQTTYCIIFKIEINMHKSDLLSIKISANAALGFMLQGFMVAYMNPALRTLHVVFDIKNVNLYDGVLSGLIPLGAGLGSLCAQTILHFFTLKNSLIFTDVITCFFCLLTISGQLWGLLIGRFFIGFAGGAQSILVPIYMNEFTPETLKGINGTLVGTLASTGAFVAFLLGFGFNENPQMDDPYWRMVFSIPIVISLLRSFILTKYYTFEAPSYYIQQKQYDKLKDTIAFIYKPEFVQKQIYLLQDSLPSDEIVTLDILRTKYKQRFQKGLVIASFMQFVGMQTIWAYSTSIFLNATNDINLTNMLNFFVPINGLINSLMAGNLTKFMTFRQIFQYGTLGCFIPMLLLSGLCINIEANMVMVVALIFIFQAFHSLSYGSFTWIELANILPPKGVSICAVVAWISASLVVQTFPYLQSMFQLSGCFLIYGLLGLVAFLYYTYEYQKEDPKEITRSLMDLELCRLPTQDV